MLDEWRCIDAIEVQLLLEAVFRRYDFDFRDYAYASITRRISNMVRAEGLQNISELQGKLLRTGLHGAIPFGYHRQRDDDVPRSELLPGFELVLSLLREYPFIRVWHVGCSTGEEVYSMAILLHEEGLYSGVASMPPI